eukprot:g6002.t1
MEDVRDRRRRINRARRTLREFLDQIHVLDILVDRTSVLTVDVGLKMHAILSSLLEYHHHQASAWTPPENRSNDPQLASQAVAQQITPGVGSPGSWLPSDVLSEVGVFDASKAAQAARDRQRQDPDPNQSAALAGGVVEDQSLCRLIQPLTFKEVAAYLRDLTRETAEQSLDKWREENFNLLCGPSRARPSRTSERSKIVPENSKKKTVMYHVDGRTPPRPMLCVDDRDATVLRAIELLLTYPDLNALPIVNPSTATVVAHVTLGQLLAYTAIQTRDPAMSALAEIEVTARTTGGNLVYRQSTNASLYRGNSGTVTEEKDEQTNRGVKNKWRTAVVRDGFLSATSSFSSTKPNAGSSAAILHHRTAEHEQCFFYPGTNRKRVAGDDHAAADSALSSYPMSLKPERLLFDVDTSVGKVLDILYEAEMKKNTLPGNRLMPGCTVITKPVASMREAMPLVLGDRATRVVFLDPRDRLLTRIFTAGDALALLLYDQ